VKTIKETINFLGKGQ